MFSSFFRFLFNRYNCESCCFNGRKECKLCKRVIINTENEGLCVSCKNKKSRGQQGGGGTEKIEVVDQLIIRDPSSGEDVEQIISACDEQISTFLSECKLKFGHIKMYSTISIKFEKESHGEEIYTTGHFICDPIIMMSNDDEKIDFYTHVRPSLEAKMEAFTKIGSDWRFHSVQIIKVGVAKFEPISGSSFFPLPEELRHPKNGILNIRNEEDEKCFLWSILAHLHPASRDKQRISHYTPYEFELDMSGIEFPVTKAGIKTFIRKNDISITVLGYENKTFFPFHLCETVKNIHVNLLLLSDRRQTHYCLITDLSRLLSAYVSDHNGSKFFCVRCLNNFGTQALLDDHTQYCTKFKEQLCVMPTMFQDWNGDETLPKMYFRNVKRQLRAPFVIYCDLESFLVANADNEEIVHQLASASY